MRVLVSRLLAVAGRDVHWRPHRNKSLQKWFVLCAGRMQSPLHCWRWRRWFRLDVMTRRGIASMLRVWADPPHARRRQLYRDESAITTNTSRFVPHLFR